MTEPKIVLSDRELIGGGELDLPGRKNRRPATKLLERNTAQNLADRYNKLDPEWTYTVRPVNDIFIVVVTNENGVEIRAL